MSKKLNKSLLHIIDDFREYLRRGLLKEDESVMDIKTKLKDKQIDISHFDEYITYARSFKEKVDASKSTKISLLELYKFHQTGHFNKFNICPIDNKIDTLKANKDSLPNTYTTCSGIRPMLNDITQWNGGLVLDMDIRKGLFDHLGVGLDDAQNDRFQKVLRVFRQQLHEKLSPYPWYLWTTLSATFGGVHIRTKCDIGVTMDTFEDFLQEVESTSHNRFQLLYNINAICKLEVCYEAMQDAARVFDEEYHLGGDLSWLEKAVDTSCLKISQGMCVVYDPQLPINPNFKDAPLYLDLYDVVVNPQSALFGIDDVETFLRRANPLGYEPTTKKAKKRASVATPTTALQDDDYDIAAFRKAEMQYEQSAKGRNDLYWRVVTFLYKEYTGENESLTLSICQKLFDPSSKNSNPQALQATIQSVIQGDYKVSSKIRSLMTQVLNGNKWRKAIEEDEKDFEITPSQENTYTLEQDEYVGDRIQSIVDGMSPGQNLVLISGTGTGKTDGIMRLVSTAERLVEIDGSFFPKPQTIMHSNGKRMLIIEPLKSIVLSKFKAYESFSSYVYEQERYDRRKSVCVAIIDKVSKSVDLGTYDKPRFDYIVIDESHMLTTSEYRQKCGLLLDFLSTQRFTSKIIYMTGTPVFEKRFMNEDTLYVQLNKAFRHPKVVNIFTQYARPFGQMKAAMAEEIRQGRKVICILRSKSNMVSIVRDLERELEQPLRYDLFFSDASNTQLAENIMNHKRLGDIDIAFVTSVFSVGIDLEGESNAVIYTYQELNGVSVDQYANRLRNMPIEFNMYGRYLGQEYRPLKSYAKDMNKQDDDAFLKRLNSGKTEAKAVKELLKRSSYPYIIYNPQERCYAINSTLYDIHTYYSAWEGWSQQWMVCEEYLRKLGYEVNIDPKIKMNALKEVSTKEQNRIKTKQRNAVYDEACVIWQQHNEAWKEIYFNFSHTSYSVQFENTPLRLGEEKKCRGENEDIDTARILYTYNTEIVEAIIDFMYIASRCRLTFEEIAPALERTMMDNRHKQISIHKLDCLIDRIQFQLAQDGSLHKVIEKINLLNDTAKVKEMARAEYDTFLTTLGKLFWRYDEYKELKNPQQMALAMDSIVKCYYHIMCKSGDENILRISPRYDKSVEEFAYSMSYRALEHKPKEAIVKLPWFYKTRSQKRSEKRRLAREAKEAAAKRREGLGLE